MKLNETEKLIGEMDSLVDWLPDSEEHVRRLWPRIKRLLEQSDNNDCTATAEIQPSPKSPDGDF